MKRINLKLCISILVIGILMPLVSFSQSKKMKKKDWSDWKAESENVTSMSLLLEDDGIEGAPALLDQNTLIFESKKMETTIYGLLI